MFNVKIVAPVLISLIAAQFARAQVNLIDQPPLADGGVFRSSQLWVDPSPEGNDLDTDAISYSGFVLGQTSTISRVDWWGKGVHEIGFQLEFWRQDPGTVSYQPLGVFRDSGASPDAFRFVTQYQTESAGSFSHHWVDLAQPITLAANDNSNPRWFLSVIARTSVVNQTWDWAEGTNGTGTFYWIRGAHMFFSDGNPRAFALTGSPVPEPASLFAISVGLVGVYARRRKRG